MTKKLGHLDLAWMSAEIAGQAARRTDDPLLAAANAWNHIEVYKHLVQRATSPWPQLISWPMAWEVRHRGA